MPTLNIPQTAKKPKPKRHHGFTVLIFLLGTLFPPLAVAARFGIGGDFWLNLFLTLAGYIPGHVHNFYIQNIRNNNNHRRTPKWAQRYGLVDTKSIKRKERRSQWANRYEERLAQSALENQPVEDGQNTGAPSIISSTDSVAPPRRGADDGELWNAQEEQYYNQSNGSSESRSRRWHYPANFDDAAASAAASSDAPKKKKKIKKDRFARTEDAYSINEDTTPRRKKKRSRRSTVGDEDTYSTKSSSTGQVPEDPEGGNFGDSARHGVAQSHGTAQVEDDTNLEHQF